MKRHSNPKRSNAKRSLRAESLESRQLLHGGALVGAVGEIAEPPTTEERVESVFMANDVNEDGMLTEDEVSERLWQRISDADTDDNAAVSTDELIAHIEARAADRVQNGNRDRGNRRGDRGQGRERIDSAERRDNFFAENDANEDGLLTEDEVSESAWERLSEADLDGDGVSVDEIMSLRELQRQERIDRRVRQS